MREKEEIQILLNRVSNFDIQKSELADIASVLCDIRNLERKISNIKYKRQQEQLISL